MRVHCGKMGRGACASTGAGNVPSLYLVHAQTWAGVLIKRGLCQCVRGLLVYCPRVDGGRRTGGANTRILKKGVLDASMVEERRGQIHVLVCVENEDEENIRGQREEKMVT